MEEPKTALVLSAGGMFGAYQAGAYKAIVDRLQPDIVVGASVGALNGWPIAARCEPRDIMDRWRDPSAGASLQLFPNAGWRNGWFDPAPLRKRTQEIFADFQPVIPFGVVVVQLPKLRTVLVRDRHVTAAHLEATCSIPLFLPTVKIDGARFLDGGFFEKLPVWAAIQMGATRIIAIDALPDVGLWWLRAGINTIRLFKPKHHLPETLDLTLISPSGYLGTANDAVFWKRENVERWMAMGERDAESVLEQKSFRVSVASNR